MSIFHDNCRPSGRLIGFDVQGTNILLENNIVYNGDDCLAIGNSANNIHFRNSYCNGGHGLSIGSLGKGGTVANVQNVLYVIHTLVGSRSLTSCSKDRKCCDGELEFGRNSKIWYSPTRRRKIPPMERGSRVGLGVRALPRSTTITCLLNTADETPLLSVTWKGITLKNVKTPVSLPHRHSKLLR